MSNFGKLSSGSKWSLGKIPWIHTSSHKMKCFLLLSFSNNIIPHNLLKVKFSLDPNSSLRNIKLSVGKIWHRTRSTVRIKTPKHHKPEEYEAVAWVTIVWFGVAYCGTWLRYFIRNAQRAFQESYATRSSPWDARKASIPVTALTR